MYNQKSTPLLKARFWKEYMNEPFKQNIILGTAHTEPDMLSLLRKIEERLASLERKIDQLSNKSQERPPFRDKQFSKPFRSFGQSPRHGQGGQNPQERSFSNERPFRKNRDDDRQGFDKKKKPFFHKKKEFGGKFR